jgi:hypothetical protein
MTVIKEWVVVNMTPCSSSKLPNSILPKKATIPVGAKMRYKKPRLSVMLDNSTRIGFNKKK